MYIQIIVQLRHATHSSAGHCRQNFLLTLQRQLWISSAPVLLMDSCIMASLYTRSKTMWSMQRDQENPNVYEKGSREPERSIRGIKRTQWSIRGIKRTQRSIIGIKRTQQSMRRDQENPNVVRDLHQAVLGDPIRDADQLCMGVYRSCSSSILREGGSRDPQDAASTTCEPSMIPNNYSIKKRSKKQGLLERGVRLHVVADPRHV